MTATDREKNGRRKRTTGTRGLLRALIAAFGGCVATGVMAMVGCSSEAKPARLAPEELGVEANGGGGATGGGTMGGEFPTRRDPARAPVLVRNGDVVELFGTAAHTALEPLCDTNDCLSARSLDAACRVHFGTVTRSVTLDGEATTAPFVVRIPRDWSLRNDGPQKGIEASDGTTLRVRYRLQAATRRAPHRVSGVVQAREGFNVSLLGHQMVVMPDEDAGATGALYLRFTRLDREHSPTTTRNVEVEAWARPALWGDATAIGRLLCAIL